MTFGWVVSALCVGCFIRTPSVSITHNTLLRYLDRLTLKHRQSTMKTPALVYLVTVAEAKNRTGKAKMRMAGGER